MRTLKVKDSVLLIVILCFFLASVHFGTTQETEPTVTDLYLIFYRYVLDENGDFTRDVYPSVMRTDGTIIVENLASFYPPLEVDVSISNFRYSFSGQWIAAETYAQRSDSAMVNQGRVFLIETETNEVTQLSPERTNSGQAQWSPQQDLLAYGVNRDLEGYLGFTFYDPLNAEFVRNIQLGDGTPLALDKIYTFNWSPDGRQIFFNTIRNRMPDPPIESSLTVGLDGQVAHILNERDSNTDFPYSLYNQWIPDGIVAFCDFPRDFTRLCLIDADTGAWAELFTLDSISAEGELRQFVFSPDGHEMYFTWAESRINVDGETYPYRALSRWSRETNDITVLLEGNIQTGYLAIQTYVPPDILDGTRTRWDERAEATVEAGG